MPPTFAQWLAAEVCDYCGWTRICQLPRVLLAKGRQPFTCTYIVRGETLRQLHNHGRARTWRGGGGRATATWGDTWATRNWTNTQDPKDPKSMRARETARLLAHHITAR